MCCRTVQHPPPARLPRALRQRPVTRRAPLELRPHRPPLPRPPLRAAAGTSWSTGGSRAPSGQTCRLTAVKHGMHSGGQTRRDGTTAGHGRSTVWVKVHQWGEQRPRMQPHPTCSPTPHAAPRLMQPHTARSPSHALLDLHTCCGGWPGSRGGPVRVTCTSYDWRACATRRRLPVSGVLGCRCECVAAGHSEGKERECGADCTVSSLQSSTSAAVGGEHAVVV